MKVQKYDEALREKVGSALALALRLARLGGGTTVPPDKSMHLNCAILALYHKCYYKFCED